MKNYLEILKEVKKILAPSYKKIVFFYFLGFLLTYTLSHFYLKNTYTTEIMIEPPKILGEYMINAKNSINEVIISSSNFISEYECFQGRSVDANIKYINASITVTESIFISIKSVAHTDQDSKFSAECIKNFLYSSLNKKFMKSKNDVKNLALTLAKKVEGSNYANTDINVLKYHEQILRLDNSSTTSARVVYESTKLNIQNLYKSIFILAFTPLVFTILFNFLTFFKIYRQLRGPEE